MQATTALGRVDRCVQFVRDGSDGPGAMFLLGTRGRELRSASRGTTCDSNISSGVNFPARVRPTKPKTARVPSRNGGIDTRNIKVIFTRARRSIRYRICRNQRSDRPTPWRSLAPAIGSARVPVERHAAGPSVRRRDPQASGGKSDVARMAMRPIAECGTIEAAREQTHQMEPGPDRRSARRRGVNFLQGAVNTLNCIGIGLKLSAAIGCCAILPAWVSVLSEFQEEVRGG